MAARIRRARKELRTVDGRVFDSISEAYRYSELAMLQRTGYISELECQPEFELQPKFRRDGKTERAIKYRADFRYRDYGGNVIVEDVKGHRTEMFKLKRRLLLYRYPDINFREVPAK